MPGSDCKAYLTLGQLVWPSGPRWLSYSFGGNYCYRGRLHSQLAERLRAFGWTAALALLLCTAPTQAQHLSEKRTTASGNVVTVYSITWPTALSPVSADVEVCASTNAPPYTFAFPSYFQLRFADGGAIGAYGSRKRPTLEKTPLHSKECVRGWLDFAVVSGQTPIAIHYHEAGADKKPIEWPVK
jgi:hypothetical protein